MDLPRSPAADAALRQLPTARVTGANEAALRKTAEQFEAMALGALMQPMFEGLGRGRGIGGGGKGEAAWAPMLVNEYARITASGGGLGIGEVVFRHMLAAQERGQDVSQPQAR